MAQQPSLDALVALGARANLVDAFVQDPARFRLEFTNDQKSKELRWVLFSASKRGAIGKIIFTLEKDATAHVKSIVINKEWRGYGLARILYHACLSTLKELGIIELHLEAEEDTKRHGKLVGLYETWGFQEKQGAKVLFLYNDTECFRKVPMVLPFYTRTFFPVQPSSSKSNSWFCMLTLKTSDGTCLMASEDGAIEARKEKSNPESLWQTLLGANGEIFLRSVHGKFLCVEESGNILADRQLNSTWETFQVVPHNSDASRSAEEADSPSLTKTSAGGIALKNFHGSYLCIDHDKNRVVSSKTPVPWDGGDIMSLVCNKSDSKPLFTKIMRKYQTSSFVKKQLVKYGDFQHASLSIADACKLVMRLNGDDEAAGSWVLKYMLASAQAVRDDGHPDWLQLAVFLRGLGMLFLCWTDEDNEVLRSVSAHEWLVKSSTWVVGVSIPDCVGYPELNELNSDHCNSIKSNGSTQMQSGMDGVVLPWTPDEYLFRVLEFNKSTLPTEALHAIRFWSLKAWHEHDQYDELCAPHDFETREWLHSLGMYASVSDDAMKNIVPDKLMPHYLSLAEKYLPAVLQW
uniref:Inositol oxygenase n=1 Tax=Globisporangium ultimum (strain ATCC 200006 / CBS 805.95 / DAOM BR144) TaxID=431595 RepID=K3X733_GLOUD